MSAQRVIVRAVDPWIEDPRTQALKERVARLEEELAAFQPELGNVLVSPWGVRFTARELALVHCLAGNAGRVVPKTIAYNAVYPNDVGPEPKILDVWLAKVRPKLARLGLRVQTLWGQGWVMSKADGALWRQWCETASRGEAPPPDYPLSLKFVGGPSREFKGRYLHFCSGWIEA